MATSRPPTPSENSPKDWECPARVSALDFATLRSLNAHRRRRRHLLLTLDRKTPISLVSSYTPSRQRKDPLAPSADSPFTSRSNPPEQVDRVPRTVGDTRGLTTAGATSARNSTDPILLVGARRHSAARRFSAVPSRVMSMGPKNHFRQRRRNSNEDYSRPCDDDEVETVRVKYNSADLHDLFDGIIEDMKSFDLLSFSLHYKESTGHRGKWYEMSKTLRSDEDEDTDYEDYDYDTDEYGDEYGRLTRTVAAKEAGCDSESKDAKHGGDGETGVREEIGSDNDDSDKELKTGCDKDDDSDHDRYRADFYGRRHNPVYYVSHRAQSDKVGRGMQSNRIDVAARKDENGMDEVTTECEEQ